MPNPAASSNDAASTASRALERLAFSTGLMVPHVAIALSQLFAALKRRAAAR